MDRPTFLRLQLWTLMWPLMTASPLSLVEAPTLLSVPSTGVDVSPAPVTTAGVAVEVAPLVPVTRSAPMTTVELEITPRILPDNLVVYSRTPRRREEPTTPATEFIEKITKIVDALVPVPSIPKRRAKTARPVSLPRRSRRIANLPPETDFASASTVCRKLDLADEEGKISEETLIRYAKFYNHLLGRDHVVALSALFGWDVPAEGQAHVAAGSVTVF
jgi:hypothetical protein